MFVLEVQIDRRTTLIALALATTCTIAAALLARARQPAYNGRTLAQWVRSIRVDGLSIQQVRALQAMGTNATPFLLEWMRYETPSWKVTAFKVTNKLRAILKKGPLNDERVPLADDATDAIWILQAQAPTLWTDCTNILLDTAVSTNVQRRAYDLLFKRAWGDPILMPYIQEQLETTDAPSQ